MWNDPLGALQKANATIKEKAKQTAESIKNNENLKQSLANAKEKSYNGMMKASAYAQENANSLYEKDYRGTLSEGIGKAMATAQ